MPVAATESGNERSILTRSLGSSNVCNMHKLSVAKRTWILFVFCAAAPVAARAQTFTKLPSLDGADGLAVAIVAHSVQASSLAVGGFNSVRGGEESIETNTSLQNLITAQFPGTTFSSASKLTPRYLSTINHLIVGVGTSCCSGTKLSLAEQNALVDFVTAGGTALLFGDNSTSSAIARKANRSFMSPFGLSMNGTLDADQPSTIVNSSNPVVTGPAGTATGFDTYYPGWFSNLGSATEIAVLTANNKPSLAYLPPGSLGTGSGAVVFFSDSNCIEVGSGGITSVNDNILILNSLALQP
jgi:hypothetical protein